LKTIRDEIQSAKEVKVIPEESAIEVGYHILQANKEVESDDPNNGTILDHIGRAKDILGDIAAAVGLVKAIAEAADVISRLLSLLNFFVLLDNVSLEETGDSE